VSEEPEIRRGLVAPAVADEHPGLWLAWTEVDVTPGPTPRELRERLRRMADRMHGAEAIAMRQREVPHAHRVFFRHIGLDPDVVRTPVEALVLRRMTEGGLRPQGLIADALNVAVLETGVGVWAFDGLVGVPRIEEAGRLVLADDAGRLAVLFGEPERAVPTKDTRRLALVAIGVPNVADVYVHEALWTAWDIIRVRLTHPRKLG
jgi:DNA/RNA-binding domain of Phe-tRNA-synthetase-like protein